MASLSSPPFAELLAKTNFSFLEGASSGEEMVRSAKVADYAALGIVDRGGVYGAPFAHREAKAQGLKVLWGAEVYAKRQQAPFYLLAKSREGYGNLCEVLTAAHKTKGHLSQKERLKDLDVPLSDLLPRCQDLILLFPAARWALPALAEVASVYPGEKYLVVSQFRQGNDAKELQRAQHYQRHFNLPLIASNQPLFHQASRKPLQDVLSCVKHNVPLTEAGFHLELNAERYLKQKQDLYRLFRGHENWLEQTVAIAESCHFSLDELTYQYPQEWIPAGHTAQSYLETLVQEGLQLRFPSGASAKVLEQIAHELALIRELRYADYFLTVWDIVRFARSQEILCQGRGSAANSTVCFVLGITAIDPVRMNLLFERFLSRERNEPPDIDIDFEHERREEVIQYIYQRYGRHRAAITAEFICFRRKSALREVGKAFSISIEEVEGLLTETHRKKLSELPAEKCPANQLYWQMAQEIRGFPRHVGTHVGGFVLSHEALDRYVPIEGAAMQHRTIVQWDKNGLDELGFVRVDVLGLGILTCIRKTFSVIEKVYGKRFELSTVPREDPNVYAMISQGDTVGVFQIESRAQMNMLPRLRPRNFFDLVVEISLVRPGPIQGQMVHPYLRRRAGKEPVEYAHPDLKEILEKTYGVPLFQEQIMKMAMKVAGFSAGEADELRRAMGTWRKEGGNRLSRLGDRFRQGLMAKGIAKEFADRIFSQIEGFAEYGFPESHAASFAILAYVTSWMKCYYPDAFLVGLLNAQPMGFYSSRTLIYEAKRKGVQVHGIDVNHSQWDNQLESAREVRLGFREIKGLMRERAALLVAAREQRKFLCVQELAQRLPQLTKRDLFLLAGADAFRSMKTSRREALWEIQALNLQDSEWFGTAFTPEGAAVELTPEGNWERVLGDMEAQRVSLFAHPMALLREELTEQGVIPSNQLSINRNRRKRVKVAGMVVSRQMPPSASGVLFITLEDEFGFMNLVVWNQVFEKYRQVLITRSFLLCEGHLQRAEDGNVTHVIVDHAESFLESVKLKAKEWG